MRVPEGEERERKSKEKNGEKLPKIDEKKKSVHPRNSMNSKWDKIKDIYLNTS